MLSPLLLVMPQPQRQCHTSARGVGMMFLEQLRFALPMKNKRLHHLWCLNNLRWRCLSHRGIQIIHLNPPSPYPVRHSMEMQQTQSKKCQQLTRCGSKGKCVVLFLITTQSEWSFFQNDLQPRNNLIWRFLFL